MRLDQATAVLRPRSSWEAIDLGCALARRDWWRLMRGFLAVALPLWLLVFVALWNHPNVAGLVLWWTKPLLTRQPVHFMSRALFGAVPGWRDFWRDRRASLWRGLLSGLTIRRFSVQRSFRLPVIMLEGLRGKAYGERCAVLGTHGGGSAFWLTYTAFKLEAVVTLALLATVNNFLTDSPYDELWEAAKAGANAINEVPVWAAQLANLCYAAAILLIEPFYASAGFALYINSRTHLEGWDIEVAFRRMSARLAALRGGVAALLVGLTAVLCVPEATAADSRRTYQEVTQPAEEMEAPDEDAVEEEVEESSAKERVEEILKAPEFAPDVRKRRISDDEMSLSLGGGGSAALRWVGYLIIIAAVVAVVLLLLRGRFAGKVQLPEGAVLPDGPRVVMGMEITKESLPDDIPGTALSLWGQGRRLEALRLLYRGALASLVMEARLPVAESDTEGDCLRHAAGLEDRGAADWFGRLTSAWIGAAYADVFPMDGSLRELCGRWPFGKPAAAGAGPRAAAALSLLTVAGAALFLTGCGNNVRYEEMTVGYKGAARFQPWLAASRLLEASWQVETRTTPGALPEEGTMLVMPLGGVRSRGEAKDLLRWASKGGHLVVLGAATDRFRNDWLNDDVIAPAAGEPLLAELGVTIREDVSVPASVSCEIEGRTLTVSAADELVMDTAPLRWCDVVAGEPSRAVLASFPRGIGRVTILTSARPWRNRWIADHDHAALLEAVAVLSAVDSVVFVNSGRMTFLEMLLEHAWMPLAALVVLIVCWLWRHLPRFGPPLPSEGDRTRHFAAQLADNGVYLWKRLPRRADLTAALRRAVMAAAEERGLHHAHDDYAAQLAARSGLPVERVIRALGEEGLDRPEDFTETIADLQRLHESCGARA